MRKHYQAGHNLFISVKQVVDLGPEAATAIMAMVRFYQGSSITRGDLPDDPAARALLFDTDMLSFTDVRSGAPVQRSGVMIDKKSAKVKVKNARDLVHHATRKAFGQDRKCPAAYRALIEGMQNTYDHADKTRGGVMWMANVFADSPGKRASFTLLDAGVGIFESVRIKFIRSVLRNLGLEDNATILRDILDRKITSSTGLMYRGRGLPSFRDAAKRGTLKNVNIISNDVHANLSTDHFRTLKEPYGGTILYWEIED
jgi:hypothetical protein